MAAGVTAGAVAATGSAAADEYETITVSPGNNRVIRVGSNETFENKLIDVSARGATVTIAAMGTNWAVRNVGITGTYDGPNRIMGVADSGGGESVIENVFAGDGVDASTGNHREPPFGIWVSPNHSGHLEIRRVNIQGAIDNGFYASAPGSNGNGKRGTVAFRNCYSKNNRIAHYRLAGGVVENCVAVNDGGPAGRNLWVWPGKDGLDVEVRDCDFQCGSYPHGYDFGQSGGTTNATVVDTDYAPAGSTRFKGNVNLDERNVGHDPTDRIPEGCPTSPEEAASGGDGAGDTGGSVSEPDGTPLRIEGETEYRIEVSEAIEPYPDFARYLEEGESHGDDWADWFVTDWTEWYVTGDLETLELSDPEGVTVRLDGEEIDPAEFGPDDEDGSELAHLLVLEGSDADVTRFEFTVDGRIERANADGATVDDETEIEDGLAHGVVGDWTEAFRFDGDLETLTVDGPAAVSLDGEGIDPSEYGDDLPHVLAVEAGADPASVSVTVDGTIEYDGDADADDVSIVSGTTVESSIAEGTRRFRFSGAVTDVTFTDGIAAISIDGEEIDPEEYGDQILFPHALVVDGTDASGSSTYSFAVDGRVVKSDYDRASIDEDDVIEGTSVRGSVANWLDAFWFDGDVEDIDVSGDARVHVEYNAREQ